MSDNLLSVSTDVFTATPVLDDVLTRKVQNIIPTSQTESSFTFTLLPSDHSFIVPEFVLRLELAIVKSNMTKLTNTDDVAPINAIHYTLWNDISCRVGDTVVCGLNQTYWLEQYLLTLLCSSAAEKQTYLKSTIGYYQDTAFEFDSFTPQSNSGYDNRKTAFSLSRRVRTIGPLNLAPFVGSKIIPASAPIVIQLRRNEDAMVLLSPTVPTPYRLKILAISLDG